MQYQGLYEALVARVGEVEAKSAIKLHYDSMVERYDERIGQMLSALERAGLYDNTVVVVTSDHGDDFFEHAVVDHGLLYDSTIRIPLVVADLRNPTTGVVVDDIVQHVDIAPTLLAYAGAKPAITMVGQPLPHTVGAVDGAYVSRPVYSLSDSCHLSWREADLKLILRDRAAAHRDWFSVETTIDRGVNFADFVQKQQLTELPMPQCVGSQVGGLPAQTYLELYDLKADPGERVNVAADRTEDTARLLKQLLQTLGERSAAMRGGSGDAMTAEQVQQMKAKGYWGFIDPTASAPDAGK
jgi:arylsulfatase A-like enzyme